MAGTALRQQGNITRRQLTGCGLSREAIDQRVASGRLFWVHTAVYAVGRPPRTPMEHASAAVLACGPGAALSHQGALALWGFTRDWPQHFDVIVDGDRRPRGIRTHRYRGLLRPDITVHFGIRLTSPARTILDVVPHLDAKTRTRTVNDALHSPYLTPRALGDVRQRFPHHPGARLLDPYLNQTGITRSHLEDEFGAFCARHDLPRPQTNVRVAGHIVDAFFPEHRLIVEVDSWEYHRDRQAFETDRDRDADTLSAGFVTVRITRRRLRRDGRDGRDGTAEAERLRTILAARAAG